MIKKNSYKYSENKNIKVNRVGAGREQGEWMNSDPNQILSGMFWGLVAFRRDFRLF